MAAETNEETFQ